ncbi:MAG: RNA-binding cell elongation regulator Jag/EloR [Candidatus Fimenecus sp.]
MEYVEKWGNTEEEAVELALVDLKLSKEDVIIEILEESNKGFLGIGKKLAKVRVSKKENTKKEEIIKEDVIKKETKTVNFSKQQFANEKKAELSEVEKNKDIAKTEKKEAKKIKEFVEIEKTPALDFLRDMIEKMGLDVEVSAKEDQKGGIYIDINGKDSACIIGKRGQTLDAIQYLTRVVVNRDEEEYTKVVVDAAEYRAKREATLIKLAKRLADKVVRTGKPVKLEPMSPYERKIIHSALQNNKKVVTKSEGKEPHRRIVIQIA